MRLGISTACFYPLPVERALDEIGKLGLRQIEVFFNTESEYREPLLSEIERRVRENGMEVVSIHSYSAANEGLLLFSEYARRTEDGFAQYRRYFEAGQRLGARYFTFHGERRMNGSPEAVIPERKLAAYERLIDTAAEYGLVFTQENVAWCRSADPAYLRALYEKVPGLRFTLDIKQAHRAGHSWQAFVDGIGDRICNIHLNDFDSEHSCLMPGEGQMDYGAFFTALARRGYDRQVLIEVYKDNFASLEDFRRAVARLAPYALP